MTRDIRVGRYTIRGSGRHWAVHVPYTFIPVRIFARRMDAYAWCRSPRKTTITRQEAASMYPESVGVVRVMPWHDDIDLVED